MTPPSKIFISYARSDGSDFAKSLRAKLIEIFGENAIWRDRDEMEGGVGWWNQIQDALEVVDFMILVATPNAMESEMVTKEWRTARQLGVCVYPVLVSDKTLDFKNLPRWMRDAHFYDLSQEWDTFINYLKTPCTVLRVPFMAESPTYFVNRPQLMGELLSRLLDKSHKNPIAITTALKGSGGFGKTTIAQAICANEDIQTAFDDGILWITLGENPSVLLELKKVYKALTGKDIIFNDTEEAGRILSEALTDKDCLIVIDDVWNISHLRPFLQGGERCARLITTRDVQIAVKAKAFTTEVDEMTDAEARQLIGNGISGISNRELDKLATRLGCWSLMLEIANSMMHIRKEATNGTWGDAYTYVVGLLDKRGVMGIRTDDENLRKQGVDGVLGASLELLKLDEQKRLYELAIFKDDQDVPMSSIRVLWGLDDTDTDDLLTKFARLSLIKYRSTTATIRLHDVIREYFLIKLPDVSDTHNQLINGYGNIYTLPDDYAWRNIAYHLVGAGQIDTLRNMLLTYRWLNLKLNHTDVNAVIDDCDKVMDSTIGLIQSAFQLSAHILVKDKLALASQLVGRLIYYYETFGEIRQFVDSINPPKNSLYPIVNGYTPLISAGGMLIRTMSHEVSEHVVSGVLLLQNGQLLSWKSYRGRQSRLPFFNDYDNPMLLWKSDGTLKSTLAGHIGDVYGAIELSDGRILSVGSSGQYLWNSHGDRLPLSSSQPEYELRDGRSLPLHEIVDEMTRHSTRQYENMLTNYTYQLSDGRILLLDDKKLQLLESDGTLITTLVGHTDTINGVMELPNNQILSWGDNTLRVWTSNVTTIQSSTPHIEAVTKILLLSDGKIVSWSDKNHIINLWSPEGRLIQTLTGYLSSQISLEDLDDSMVFDIDDYDDDKYAEDDEDDDEDDEDEDDDYNEDDYYEDLLDKIGSRTDDLLKKYLLKLKLKGNSIQVFFHFIEEPQKCVFYGDAPFTSIIVGKNDIIVVGDKAGRVVFLRWVGEDGK